MKGLEEIVPKTFQKVVSFFDDYDFLGTRIRNQLFKNIVDTIKYGINVRKVHHEIFRYHRDVLMSHFRRAPPC